MLWQLDKFLNAYKKIFEICVFLFFVVQIDKADTIQVGTGFKPLSLYVGEHTTVGFLNIRGVVIVVAAHCPVTGKGKSVNVISRQKR